jgi:hypothetical protein
MLLTSLLLLISCGLLDVSAAPQQVPFEIPAQITTSVLYSRNYLLGTDS